MDPDISVSNPKDAEKTRLILMHQMAWAQPQQASGGSTGSLDPLQQYQILQSPTTTQSQLPNVPSIPRIAPTQTVSMHQTQNHFEQHQYQLLADESLLDSSTFRPLYNAAVQQHGERMDLFEDETIDDDPSNQTTDHQQSYPQPLMRGSTNHDEQLYLMTHQQRQLLSAAYAAPVSSTMNPIGSPSNEEPMQKMSHLPHPENIQTVSASACAVTPSFVVTAPSSVSPSPCAQDVATTPTVLVPPFLLHKVCCLFPSTDSVVQSALRIDPEGIRRRLDFCSSQDHDINAQGYTFPINIALQHNASLEVVQLLVDAGPDILTEKDGPNECCALATALHQKQPLPVIQLILHGNPDVVRVIDHHSNYPLHAACVNGCSVDIVKFLANTYPNALRKRNFHGMTPLLVAQRSNACSDELIDYLQDAAFGALEDEAIMHLDDL